MRVMLKAAAAAGLVCSSFLFEGAAQPASFDCAKAATADERAVCADPLLSSLDSRLGKAFGEVKADGDYDDVFRVARDFLADRGACGAERACILSTYLAVLNSYRVRGARGDPLGDLSAVTIADSGAPMTDTVPEKIGECARTSIVSVHPRLGDGGPVSDSDFDFGTGVDFENGGYQVSYEREEALLRSKPGDPVVMCLVSIPHGCPPGDERGREFAVTNERTGETWTLPDSQHSCGGA